MPSKAVAPLNERELTTRAWPVLQLSGALLLCSLHPTTAWAQYQGGGTEFAQLGNSYSSELFITPFKYVAPKALSSAAGPDEAESVKRPPQQQRIVELSNSGEYGKAGSEGLALISTEKPDDGLQLIIANSLAWSGRLKEATAAYQAITQEPLVDDANVGIANILRWQGRDEAAAPMYRDILGKNPEHVDARNGLELAERELAPRTTIMLGRSSDSSESIRGAASVNHRWRDDTGYKIYEVEAGAIRDELPGVEARQQDVTLRYSDRSLELKPTLEINAPTNINKSVFGSLKFLVDDDRIQFDIGRTNWSKMASNANALLAGLTATHVGINAKRDYDFGNATARVDYYNISDENTLWSSDVRLTSSARPFGNNIKPYIGVETRKASFVSPNYWSPSEGSGSLYGGLNGEWLVDEWSLYGSAQLGLALYGDAGTSWMLSGGVKRWITNNVALSLNLWGMSSTRAGTEYRAQSANVFLEKVWR